MTERGPAVSDEHIEAGCMAAWEVSRPFIARHLNGGKDPGTWADQEEDLRNISRDEVRASYEAIRSALSKSTPTQEGE